MAKTSAGTSSRPDKVQDDGKLHTTKNNSMIAVKKRGRPKKILLSSSSSSESSNDTTITTSVPEAKIPSIAIPIKQDNVQLKQQQKNQLVPVSDINQRPRRQIKHKFIKSTWNSMPEVSLTHSPIQEIPPKVSISPPSATLENLNKTIEKSITEVEVAAQSSDPRPKGRRGRKKKMTLNSDGSSSNDSVILQLNEIFNDSEGASQEGRFTVDSDQYEVPSVGDASQYQPHHSLANTKMPYVVIDASSECRSKNRSYGPQKIYVEITESLDTSSQEILKDTTHDSNGSQNSMYNMSETEIIYGFEGEQPVVKRSSRGRPSKVLKSFEGALAGIRKSRRVNKDDSSNDSQTTSVVVKKLHTTNEKAAAGQAKSSIDRDIVISNSSNSSTETEQTKIIKTRSIHQKSIQIISDDDQTTESADVVHITAKHREKEQNTSSFGVKLNNAVVVLQQGLVDKILLNERHRLSSTTSTDSDIDVSKTSCPQVDSDDSPVFNASLVRGVYSKRVKKTDTSKLEVPVATAIHPLDDKISERCLRVQKAIVSVEKVEVTSKLIQNPIGNIQPNRQSEYVPITKDTDGIPKIIKPESTDIKKLTEKTASSGEPLVVQTNTESVNVLLDVISSSSTDITADNLNDLIPDKSSLSFSESVLMSQSPSKSSIRIIATNEPPPLVAISPKATLTSPIKLDKSPSLKEPTLIETKTDVNEFQLSPTLPPLVPIAIRDMPILTDLQQSIRKKLADSSFSLRHLEQHKDSKIELAPVSMPSKDESKSRKVIKSSTRAKEIPEDSSNLDDLKKSPPVSVSNKLGTEDLKPLLLNKPKSSSKCDLSKGKKSNEITLTDKLAISIESAQETNKTDLAQGSNSVLNVTALENTPETASGSRKLRESKQFKLDKSKSSEKSDQVKSKPKSEVTIHEQLKILNESADKTSNPKDLQKSLNLLQKTIPVCKSDNKKSKTELTLPDKPSDKSIDLNESTEGSINNEYIIESEVCSRVQQSPITITADATTSGDLATQKLALDLLKQLEEKSPKKSQMNEIPVRNNTSSESLNKSKDLKSTKTECKDGKDKTKQDTERRKTSSKSHKRDKEDCASHKSKRLNENGLISTMTKCDPNRSSFTNVSSLNENKNGRITTTVPKRDPARSSTPTVSSQTDNKSKLKVRQSRWDNVTDSKSKPESKKVDAYAILSGCYLPKMVKHDESLYSIEALKAAEAAAIIAEQEAVAERANIKKLQEAAEKKLAEKLAADRAAAAEKRAAEKVAAEKAEAAKKIEAAKIAAEREARKLARKAAAAMHKVPTFEPLKISEVPATKDPPNPDSQLTSEECPILDEQFFLTDYQGIKSEAASPITYHPAVQSSPDIKESTDTEIEMKNTIQNELDTSIRRSGRLRSLSKTKSKERSHGFGLVKDKDRIPNIKPEMNSYPNLMPSSQEYQYFYHINESSNEPFIPPPPKQTKEEMEIERRDMIEGLGLFTQIFDCEYMSERYITKESKRMTCDCFLTKAEIERGEFGCGEDCLNRLLLIECGSRCVVRDRCTNKRFQKHEYADCTIFKTDKKGFGMKANSLIAAGEFIMEYVGEVLNGEQFDDRVVDYSKDKNKHHYFMALRSDCVIDATLRGNISRFINHSCEPNAETQKWTVNGELRIGFFSKKTIQPNEEITFDYKFQRYGKSAQRCYCEADNCRGWIDTNRGSDCEEEDDEDEDYEEEPIETPDVLTPIIDESSEKDKESVPSLPSMITELVPKTSPATDDAVTLMSDLPLAFPTNVETKIVHLHKDKLIQKKQDKKQIMHKRAEIMEDPDLDREIKILIKTNLKNQSDTLRFSRLVVRAKLWRAKSQLLEILRNGELACRRLFLDYHGLKLLYTWMCDSISTDFKFEWEFRFEILETLEVLPIPNKLMLQDSKVLSMVSKWAKATEATVAKEISPEDSPSDSGSGTPMSDDSNGGKTNAIPPHIPTLINENLAIQQIGVDALKEIISTNESNESRTLNESLAEGKIENKVEDDQLKAILEEYPELKEQIRALASKLVTAWELLPEAFRIPKKQRIEQMKEHEREANRSYRALGLSNDNEKPPSNRYQNRIKERDFSKDFDRERYRSNRFRDVNRLSLLTKLQRRQIFEARVAADKKKNEETNAHNARCTFFRLNPRTILENDVPFAVDPQAGQWYGRHNQKVPTPPSHMHIIPPPKVMSTNPDDYNLPPLDLPKFWKFAIDTLGRVYYYHVKILIPQWHPPIKLLPLTLSQSGVTSGKNETKDPTKVTRSDLLTKNIDLNSDEDGHGSSSSDTDSGDSSEEEMLERTQKLEGLVRNSDINLMLKPPPNLAEEICAMASTSDNTQPIKVTQPLQVNVDFDYLESILPSRRKKRAGLVQERIISPRTDEEKRQLKLETRRYKENKEKMRRRKEESKRKKLAASSLSALTGDPPRKLTKLTEGLPKLSSEDETADHINTQSLSDSPVSSGLAIKNKFVDELDALKNLSKRLKMDTATLSTESSDIIGNPMRLSKRKKLVESSSIHMNSDARRIKEKFRIDIAGVIVHHLGSYRKDTCRVGRITNVDDFKHLAKKLTEFVLIKELKHCENTANVLEVTDSVKMKSKEFIRKYMRKFGPVYIKPDNDPEFKDISHRN